MSDRAELETSRAFGLRKRRAAMTTLQKFLRDLVLDTGVAQNELARRTGLTEKHISEMMNGWSQGKLTAWQALLDAAGVHLASSPPLSPGVIRGRHTDPQEAK